MRRYSVWLPLLCLLIARASTALAVPFVTATVPIGPRPVAVIVDNGGHQVYVADVELGAVVQFDGGRGAIVGTVQVDGQPASLAMDNRGRRLFVGNRDQVGAAVTVVDLASAKVQTVLPAGRRVRALAFDEEINRLYVGDADAGQLLIVDGASAAVTQQVPLGGTPVGIAVNPKDGEVAVVVQGPSPSLALLDPNDRNAAPVQVPVTEGQPVHVAVDSTTGKFFVTRAGTNSALLVLRPGSSQFDNAIPVAPGVTGLAIDSRTSRIYLAHGSAGLATVIDGASGTPLAVLPLDAGANHIAVDEASTPTRVYGVDTTNGLLSILTDQ